MGRSWLIVLGLFAGGIAASQAEDLERGKSGPAIFAADCAACHRSAQGLAYGMSASELMGLLRQHYTTGPGPANQVASYLLSVVGNGRRPKEKPLTEPQGSSPAGEQASKRRPRGEEADPAGPRPPGEIRGNEAAVSGPASVTGDRNAPASKRSKKPGQPATAARGPEVETARPPDPIRTLPSDSARPPEPAEVRPVPSSRETKPAGTAPRPEGAKAEAAPEPVQVRAAAPSEARKPRPEAGDQPAFSAPSP